MQKARLRPISIAPFLLPRHLLPTSTCTTGRREARSSWSHSGRGWHCSHKYTPERDGSPHPERSEGSLRPSRQTRRRRSEPALRGCVQSGLRSLDEVTEQKRCISYKVPL